MNPDIYSHIQAISMYIKQVYVGCLSRCLYKLSMYIYLCHAFCSQVEFQFLAAQRIEIENEIEIEIEIQLQLKRRC